MKTISYDDGMVIEHKPATGWIDPEDGDADGTPSECRVSLPAGSIAALEESLRIAAARCIAADVARLEFGFGPNSALRFTGRMVGAGTTCEWLDVQLRIERAKWGDAMPVAHLVGALEDATRGRPHEIVGRVVAFLRAIGDCAVIDGATQADCRRSPSERIASSEPLEMRLENAAKQHGGVLVEA